MKIEEFPVAQLLPGMSVTYSAGVSRILEIWDYSPVRDFEEYGRAARGMRWVVMNDGRGRRGATVVMDVDDMVTVRV